MDTVRITRFKTPLLVLTALILVWGVLGILDVHNQTYNGYGTDGNNTITRLDNGGPADAAGLRTGDYIRSIGGIPVEDTRALVQRPRPAVSEVRTFVVERDGETASFELRYASLPIGRALTNYGAIVVGVLFLAFGVWAFLTAPSLSTGLLAVLGVSFAPAFGVGPYFNSPALRTAVTVVALFLILVGLAVLTHFLLVFPQKKRAMERRAPYWGIYGPAALVGALAAWFLVAQPAATSTLNIFFRVVFGLSVVGYFGASLIALLHSYAKAAAPARAANGLNLLLTGAIVGLGPSLVMTLVGIVAPQIAVPGAQFLPLSVGLLPVLFALGAVRGVRTARPA